MESARPAPGQQADGVLIGRASQDGFRQGRLVVGKFRFFPDEDDLPLVSFQSERLRSAHPGDGGPDDDGDCVIRPPLPVRRLGSCGRPR